MAAKKFVVDIDLSKNQLLNAVIQNLATAPSSPNVGQIYYNTTDDVIYGFNGTGWVNMFGDGGTGSYTHPTSPAGALDLNVTGANVLATFETNAEGHIVAASTRALTLSDLGYTPYEHPTFAGNDLGAALTGAKVISDIDVNADGHVTGITTRDLTASDIGAAIINNATTSSNETWSSQKIANEIASALAGGMSYEGNYDAANNTPNLDISPSGVLKGFTYTVSNAGTFFTEEVQAGDMLIAKTDDPTTLSDWSVINKNIPDIGDATAAIKGLIQLASEAEALAGTNNTKAITPATLKAVIDERTSGVTKKYAANIGDGSATSIAVTHNLGTTDIDAMVKDASGSEIICAVTTTNANTITLGFNTAPAANAYRVVIIG